jgi:ElaB/YqjD/DUF883 family membrane-anchored ribosome-binding protein
MSDPGYTGTGQPRPDETTQQGLRQAGEDLRATARQAREAAKEAGSTIASEAAAAAETLKQEGASLLDTAKTRAQDLADQGKQVGAERTEGIARAIHRAAESLEQDSPEFARTVHDAAGAVDNIARALRERSPGDMLRGAEDFARRQPMAFVGLAALAGFALARFAKASAEHHGRQDMAHRVHTGPYTSAGAQPMAGEAMGSGAMTSGAMTSGDTTSGDMASGSGMTDQPSAGQEVGSSGYPHGPATPHDTAQGAPGWVPDENGTPRPATLASASLGGAVSYRPRGGTENG